MGYISILHLRISDLKDPACDECIKLAEKASHAVDFPKTGTPVTFSDLPKPDRLKPDFLSWEGTNLGRSSAYYPSKKVLGVLFRRVPMPAEHSQRRYNLFEEHSKILDALRLVPYHTLGLEFQFPSEELLDEMEDKLWAYSEQLMVIAQAHTDSKSPNAHLTEAELVSGTIQAKWADHHKRREAVIAMNLQVYNPFIYCTTFGQILKLLYNRLVNSRNWSDTSCERRMYRAPRMKTNTMKRTMTIGSRMAIGPQMPEKMKYFIGLGQHGMQQSMRYCKIQKFSARGASV